MVDSRDHALQVKWLWAMAAWYDNLQMTLTGLVRVLTPPVLPHLAHSGMSSAAEWMCAARLVHVLSSVCITDGPRAQFTGQVREVSPMTAGGGQYRGSGDLHIEVPLPDTDRAAR
jgi:hypothetical protein